MKLFPFLAVLLILVASLPAETFTTLDGDKYTGATIKRIEPDGLVIAYPDGVVKLKFKNLPPAIGAKYGYSPASAAAFQAEQLSDDVTAYQKALQALDEKANKEASVLEKTEALRNQTSKPDKLKAAQWNVDLTQKEMDQAKAKVAQIVVRGDSDVIERNKLKQEISKYQDELKRYQSELAQLNSENTAAAVVPSQPQETPLHSTAQAQTPFSRNEEVPATSQATPVQKTDAPLAAQALQANTAPIAPTTPEVTATPSEGVKAQSASAPSPWAQYLPLIITVIISGVLAFIVLSILDRVKEWEAASLEEKMKYIEDHPVNTPAPTSSDNGVFGGLKILLLIGCIGGALWFWVGYDSTVQTEPISGISFGEHQITPDFPSMKVYNLERGEFRRNGIMICLGVAVIASLEMMINRKRE